MPLKSQRWFDPRFAIGVTLILGSVAGVVALLANADSSTTVFAARSTLNPGDVVTADDLTATSVRLTRAEQLYVGEGAMPKAGVVVTRSVAAGELVPASAVGSHESLTVTAMVLESSTRLPESVKSGALVDVWAAAEVEPGVFEAPEVLVASATVVRLVRDAGLIRSEENPGIELLVPRFATAKVLDAIANAAAISVVPAELPAETAPAQPDDSELEQTGEGELEQPGEGDGEVEDSGIVENGQPESAR